MTFGRDKRLLLGGLAFIAPLPLPLNDVIGWPSVLCFCLAVGLFLHRAWRDVGGWLPNWAMNVLAIAYLPLFVLDLGVLLKGKILQPVVHLLLFALVIKLFALKREKDKWQTMLVLFFVFLAATGTSVHPAVMVYVVAFLAGALLLLSRFVGYDLLARNGRKAPAGERIPLGGFVTGGVLFALVLAVPLFVFMPRLRSPYLVGPGAGAGSLTQVASFQDVMRLDGIGRVRGSRAVVMRLTYDTPPPRGHETRMKVKVYDHFSGDEWMRSRGRATNGLRGVRRNPDGYFPLGQGRVVSWMGVWMQPIAQRYLSVPVDGIQFDLLPTAVDNFIAGAAGPSIVIDDSGEVMLPLRPTSMVRYRVGLVDRPRVAVTSPLFSPDIERNLGLGGISPRLTDLAGQVMGDGSNLERAARAERYLSTTFEYTTELIGTPAGERVETFVFDTQRGHCELFASAMVLMLRSQGIPARLATGFLGADFNPLEGYYIVRESNAHAWVEMYAEGAGWLVFDPTPPAGRPISGESNWTDLAEQLYDSLIFRWDRYILTFGLADQIGFVAGIRDLWQTISGWFSGTEAEAAAVAPGSLEPGPQPAAIGTPSPDAGPAPWWPLAAALFLASAAFSWVHYRRFNATAAYVRLRERLRPEFPARAGRNLEAVAPLEVARHYAEKFPGAAQPARELVDLYLDESFGGRRLSPDELKAARGLLRRALDRRAA